MSRPTRTNVRGVSTHAKSCKEEDEEGRKKEDQEVEEEGEEIAFTFRPRRLGARGVHGCSRLGDMEYPMTKAKAAVSGLGAEAPPGAAASPPL